MRCCLLLTLLALSTLSPSCACAGPGEPAAAEQDAPVPATAPASTGFAQDWVLLYWIPYDNDLAAYAQPVLQQLADAPSSSRVVIAAQIDEPDAGDMRRLVYAGAPAEQLQVPSENSASAEALGEFLRWAGERFESRRYALIVLDHGGGVPQLGLDEHPARGDAALAQWLSLPELARALEAFDAREAGAVELVYLQVCVKATLEAAYELREATPQLLASQLVMRAPNSYYAGALGQLRDNPQMDGAALARSIARHEQPAMVAALSLVHTAGLERLVASFPRPAGHTPADALPPSYSYWTDRYVDLLALARTHPDAARVAAFERVLDDVVEVNVASAAGRIPSEPAAESLSGLSVHVPLAGTLLPGYEALALYRDAELRAYLSAVGARLDEAGRP